MFSTDSLGSAMRPHYGTAAIDSAAIATNACGFVSDQGLIPGSKDRIWAYTKGMWQPSL